MAAQSLGFTVGPHIVKTGNWNIAFALIDSIISFIKSFKITFITASFFLISTAMVLSVHSKALLWFSILVLIAIIFVVYIQRSMLALKPTGIYQSYIKFFSFAGNNVRNSYGSEQTELSKVPVESMDERQLDQWVMSVQQLVLFNRFCLFVAKGLRSYNESGIALISSIFSILFLILFTIFSFAVINFGLFKIDPTYFSFSNAPTFFSFFYYSFNLLLFNLIQGVVAETYLSQAVQMVEFFFALFLVAIFVTLVFSFKSQKYAGELNKTIEHLTEEGNSMEQYIRENYDLDNIDIAIEALQKFRSSMVGLLYTISKAIS